MIYSKVSFVDNFEASMLFDNVEAVTLKCKPTLWDHQYLFEKDFDDYCEGRNIDYVLFAERGVNNNLHYHGIIIYPFDKVRINFQRWFNRYYGTVHRSVKGDPHGWYTYCSKAINQVPPNPVANDIPYLFDPQYEPLVNDAL